MPNSTARHNGARLKPHIDSNLAPVEPLSIAAWNELFDDLSLKVDLVERDLFALTGRYFDEEEELYRRAALDTDSCKLYRGISVQAECDIDSIIGVITGDFPIANEATFNYFMLPDVRYTLKSNLHVPGVRVHNGDDEEVLIHRTPNARFGEIGDRFLVRIFFPGLRDETKEQTEPNYVGEGPLQLFYDSAVQPATVEVIPEGLRRQWPSRYTDEKFRASSHLRQTVGAQVSGGARYQHSGREVHGEYLNNWVAAIRDRVAGDHEVAFAAGFFFVVEGRGLKHKYASNHEPPLGPLADEVDGLLYDANNERTQALDALLADFKPAMFTPGDWFLDIGTTLSGSREDEDGVQHPVSLFVNPRYHPEIMNFYSGKPISVCQHWVTTGSGGYQRDEIAHLGDIAGFRIDFDEPGADRVHYLQVYSSEKSVTYHVDNLMKAKRTSPHAVLTNWKRERDAYFVPLRHAFANASASHSVAVRIESRVGFESYPHVHLMVPGHSTSFWLYQMDNTAYWGFKFRRVMALTNVLERLMSSPARLTFTKHELPEVGSLLVLLIWMTNALVNRPDDGGHWDEVCDAGSVHTMKGNAAVPCRPLGIYYLHSLYLSADGSQLPRISSHRTITIDTIVYLCGTAGDRNDQISLWRLIQGNGATATEPTGPSDPWKVSDPKERPVLPGASRASNRQRRVTIRPADDVDDAFADTIPNIERVNHYDSEDDDDEVREEGPSLSQQVTGIVWTFPVQIFAKVPNRKGGRSWCTLGKAERGDITFDIFCETGAPSYLFTSYVSHGRDYDKWHNTVNAYFPTRKEKVALGKIQGLSQLSIWEDWESLLAAVPPAAAARIVKQARDLVHREWRWLPWFTKGHLWSTGTRSTGQVVGIDDGGPWIVFNPRYK
ncbi:hypothetical protein FRC06_003758 [Ceratobasidium sp. 370]|nr:hypothetical protein FRC06_003758 [Ceratobasidium sp. 370]